MIATEVNSAIPGATETIVWKSRKSGLENLGICVMGAEEEPFLSFGNVVIHREWYLPSMNQLREESKIPIIDISPLSEPNTHLKFLRKVGDEIRDACKNVGFFYVINHEISESHLDNLI